MAQENGETFRLPGPKFKDEVQKALDCYSRHLNPHFSTPTGMLMPRDKQPPPMYGPRGPTVPPQYLPAQRHNPRKRPAGGYNGYPSQPRQPFRYGGQPPRRPPGLEKDVVPELLRLDWNLWCAGCDVNCRNEEEYRQHLDRHVPCAVAGCTFVGHPMVMKKHASKVHVADRPEAAEAIAKPPSNEEIERWREERRKRYPTKQNVIVRQQAQEERFKRGERIEENKERFPKRPGSNETTHAKPFVASKRQKRRRRGKVPDKCPEEKDSGPGRIAFVGTAALEDYREPTASNALGMLGVYGSDSASISEDEDESVSIEPEHPCIVDQKHVPKVLGEVQPKDDGQREQVPPAAVPMVADRSEEKEPQGSATHCKQKHRGRHSDARPIGERPTKKYLLDYSKLRRATQNTMLEKLLDADIRHERNVLLQCVRHVVSSQFFGVGQLEETEVKEKGNI
ncbi:FMR1-interacting protein NUFIP1 [Anopheles bellator]|uniref:FMR1-interacting protein NUFIP1 n=1 Tax=Anopheles bellator TaxID=139047 RepID=UPI0026492789|nr:FMR1-interacting protein NUFIP1 [Anopheles bellator]